MKRQEVDAYFERAFADHFFTARVLTHADAPMLQSFLDLFDDFFLLCEGEKISSHIMLSDVPGAKDPEDCKYVIAFYENGQIICLIDLIRDYPEPHTWTIGYLMISPFFGGKKRQSHNRVLRRRLGVPRRSKDEMYCAGAKSRRPFVLAKVQFYHCEAFYGNTGCSSK